MVKFISHRTHETHVEYTRHFERKDKSGGGFAFSCDKHGKLYDITEATKICVTKLIADPKFRDDGIVSYQWPVVLPAVIECECCKAHVALFGFTNTCSCGADYNMSGALLADRSQWGEETGESVSDILAVDGGV